MVQGSPIIQILEKANQRQKIQNILRMISKDNTRPPNPPPNGHTTSATNTELTTNDTIQTRRSIHHILPLAIRAIIVRWIQAHANEI